MNLVMNRIGYLDSNQYYHWMRDYFGDRTACGLPAEGEFESTKNSSLYRVDCPKCWEIKRGN